MTTGGAGNEYPDFHDAGWTRGLFRPLLIAMVSVGLVAGPLSIVQAVTGWRLSYFLPLALVAALESIYSTGRLGRPKWRDRRGLLYRLGELVALFVVLRLLVWRFGTSMPGLAEFQLWLRHPSAFLDDQFVLSGLLLLLAWGLAVAIAGDFLELAIQPDEVAAQESHAWGETSSEFRAFRPTTRADIVGRFMSRWSWGGILLVFFAALSRLDVGLGEKGNLRLGLGQLGLPPEILAALLAYFLGGLLLLSQARLAMLRGRWYNERLTIQPSVLSRWQVSSFFALLLIAAVAALLPIGSTSWLSLVLTTVIAFLARVIYLIVMLFAFLLGLLFYPLHFLSTNDTQQPAPELPKMDVPSQAQMASRLPDWLGGALVWLLVAAIAAYFLLNYLHAHDLLKGRWLNWLEVLRYWWRSRWARVSRLAHDTAAELRKRLRRPVGLGGIAGPRLVRAGRLQPRERVRYFYLRTVRRAADRGLTRPAHKTPLEFAEDLEKQWPEADVDVDKLTEAFVSARYDRRPIVNTEAYTVQSVWRRVMRALRSRAERRKAPQ